jgi:hypothetical protein
MDLIGNEAPTHPESLGHKGLHLLDDYIPKERSQIQTKYTPMLKRIPTYLKRTEKFFTISSFLKKVF